MGQNRDGGFPFLFRDLNKQLIRKLHIQQEVFGCIRKATQCLRMAIGVGDLGLDVENGSAVHQVGTGYMNHGSVISSLLYAQ